MPNFSDFLDIQTKTAWGRSLADFAAFCDPQPAEKILDVGSGPGLLPALFTRSGCRAIGVDVDYSLLVSHLHPGLATANAYSLPFPDGTFNMVTAVNVLFLLDDPPGALAEMVRVLKPGGQVVLLNPSEHLSVEAAMGLADKRGLEGKARQSLINWARNAESHLRWTEAETADLFRIVNLNIIEMVLRIGPGFARCVRGKGK